MSEYQYYEFQAIDRALSPDEMQTLRGFSARAQITASSFANQYAFSGFKGTVDRWMATYFDAFLYVANWGTRTLMLRLPATLLPEAAVNPFCDRRDRYPNAPTVRVEDDHSILTLRSNNEEGRARTSIKGEGLLASLMPIRAELARGDLRALYLGWLRGIQDQAAKDSSREPLVPPGLKSLSPALVALVGFLEIDPDLLAAAAAASSDLPSPPADRPGVRLKRGSSPKAAAPQAPSRTVSQLLAAAEAEAKRREREAALQAAAARDRAHQEAAQARVKHLESLATRVPETWNQVEELIAVKESYAYAQAVRILSDLREVARKRHTVPDFEQRLVALRERHVKKKSLIQQLAAEQL